MLERQADITDPLVQSAMSGGTSVWDFEKQLKNGTEWLTTKNAQSSLYETIAEAGRRLGFE